MRPRPTLRLLHATRGAAVLLVAAVGGAAVAGCGTVPPGWREARVPATGRTLLGVTRVGPDGTATPLTPDPEGDGWAVRYRVAPGERFDLKYLWRTPVAPARLAGIVTELGAAIAAVRAAQPAAAAGAPLTLDLAATPEVGRLLAELDRLRPATQQPEDLRRAVLELLGATIDVRATGGTNLVVHGAPGTPDPATLLAQFGAGLAAESAQVEPVAGANETTILGGNVALLFAPQLDDVKTYLYSSVGLGALGRGFGAPAGLERVLDHFSVDVGLALANVDTTPHPRADGSLGFTLGLTLDLGEGLRLGGGVLAYENQRTRDWDGAGFFSVSFSFLTEALKKKAGESGNGSGG